MSQNSLQTGGRLVKGYMRAGVARQKVELLLPGDIDGSGFPGGIKQQFVAVRDMVEAILLQLKQLPEFQVPATPHPIPDKGLSLGKLSHIPGIMPGFRVLLQLKQLPDTQSTLWAPML